MSNPPGLPAIVLIDLRRGFGVEDIADRHSIPVKRVRKIVAELRMWGLLAETDWQELAP
ncbi:Rrf2 family transcriptional regulator [Paracoccus methylarcula]|uniref:Rrf2 family transcriptional regulator n=1 Tax=Paracoccus methylarcula TaxID=72022 RepID=UPI0011CECCDE|nr:Rrf2 family transcriptional regulator [Paracoccus methylarcula]